MEWSNAAFERMNALAVEASEHADREALRLAMLARDSAIQGGAPVCTCEGCLSYLKLFIKDGQQGWWSKYL